MQLEDMQTFVWLRACPSAASRDVLKQAFYDGPDWAGQLEQQLMPLLEHYGSVLVEDHGGLWRRWPSGAR